MITLGFWAGLAAALAAGGAVIVAAALVAERFSGGFAVRRMIWQLAFVLLLTLAASELTGAGRAAAGLFRAEKKVGPPMPVMTSVSLEPASASESVIVKFPEAPVVSLKAFAPEKRREVWWPGLVWAAGDPLWRLLADLACALLWWNPLAWLARGRFHAACELAADEAAAVVEDGPATLAECLLSLGRELPGAGRWAWMGMDGGGFRSNLGRRIERLTRRDHDFVVIQRKPSRAAAIASGTALVFLTVVISGWAQSPAQGGGVARRFKNAWQSSPGAALLAAATPVASATSSNPAPAQSTAPLAKPKESASAATGLSTTNTSAEIVQRVFRIDSFGLLAAIEREPNLTYRDIDDDIPDEASDTNPFFGGESSWVPQKRKSTTRTPQHEASSKFRLYGAFIERMGLDHRLRGRSCYYGDRKGLMMIGATLAELDVIEKNLSSRGVLATEAPTQLFAKAVDSAHRFSIIVHGPSTNTVETGIQKVFKVDWTNFDKILRRENPDGMNDAKAQKWCKSWLERQGAKWRDDGPGILVNPINEEVDCFGLADDLKIVEDILLRLGDPAKVDVSRLKTVWLGSKATETNEPNDMMTRAYALAVDLLARFGSNAAANPGATNDIPAIRAINALCQKAGFDARAPGRAIYYGENPPRIEVRATLAEQMRIEEALSALNPETNAAARKLYTKMFQLELASLQSDIRRIPGYESVTLTNDASAAKARARLQEYFTSKGADFAAPGKAIFFNSRASQLYVRAGLTDLEIVENTINNANIADIQRRELRVDTGSLVGRMEEEMRAKGLAYSGKGGLSAQASEALKTLFAREGAGMDKPGAQVLFDIATGRIIVDARPADWPAIEGVLNRLGRAPQQIQLEAKYYLLDEPAFAGLTNLFNTLDVRAQVELTEFRGDVRPDQFASLPARLRASASADAAPVVNKGMPVLAALNNEQNTRIADFLGKRDGVSRLARQSVTTLDRRRASLFVNCSKESNSVESLPPVGISLNIFPKTNDSAGIYLQIETTAMGKLGTIQDIPPSKRAENHISEDEARLDAASTNHAPVFKTDRDSRAFIARDQQPVLLAGLRYWSSLDASQRIVIILTPTLIDPAGNPIH